MVLARNNCTRVAHRSACERSEVRKKPLPKSKSARPTAWINVYEFDMDAAIKAGFKLLRFDAYDQDWLNFIVASRNGKQPWTGYDIIEGGVANDRVIDTIEDYLNDIITIEQALGQLVYAQPNHQICLLNQQLIDTHLHFDKSFPLDTMDRKGGNK